MYCSKLDFNFLNYEIDRNYMICDDENFREDLNNLKKQTNNSPTNN